MSWAPVPNKPTVSVDVKQHFNQLLLWQSSTLCQSFRQQYLSTYSACKHDSSVKNKTKQKTYGHMVRAMYDCNQLSEKVVSASSVVSPTLKFRPRYRAPSVSVASTLYLSGVAWRWSFSVPVIHLAAWRYLPSELPDEVRHNTEEDWTLHRTCGRSLEYGHDTEEDLHTINEEENTPTSVVAHVKDPMSTVSIREEQMASAIKNT